MVVAMPPSQRSFTNEGYQKNLISCHLAVAYHVKKTRILRIISPLPQRHCVKFITLSAGAGKLNRHLKRAAGFFLNLYVISVLDTYPLDLPHSVTLLCSN